MSDDTTPEPVSESGTPEATEWPPEMIEAAREAWAAECAKWPGPTSDKDAVTAMLDAALAFRSGGEPVLVKAEDRTVFNLTPTIAYSSTTNHKRADALRAAEAEVERLTAERDAEHDRAVLTTFALDRAEARCEVLRDALRAVLIYAMHEHGCEMVSSRPDHDLDPPCTCGCDSARIVARSVLGGTETP